jgi:molecular chaperone DnaJ
LHEEVKQMTERDYYEILGVPRDASAEAIKQAFRRLARQHHPDVSDDPAAEERFKEINEAYAVLSDDQKRSAYDRFGHAGVQGAGGVPDFGAMDFADIFEEFFGFGRSWGGQRSRNSPRRGADLQYTIHLTFEESVFGVEKEIEITRDESCQTCDGSGSEPGTSPVRCTICNGTGEIRQTRQSFFGSMVQVSGCPTCQGRGETISNPCRTCQGSGLERRLVKKVVTIPAGVDTGNQIRMTGEGQPGLNNGPNGHVYLGIKVKPHKYFRRRNNDIMLDLDINIPQAALGAEVEIPTIDGPVKLTIPAGTQPGKTFRVRGKGVPYLRGNGRGDQIVLVSIDIPKRISEEQRELFEQLAESMGSEVRPQERSFLDRLKDVLGA